MNRVEDTCVVSPEILVLPGVPWMIVMSAEAKVGIELGPIPFSPAVKQQVYFKPDHRAFGNERSSSALHEPYCRRRRNIDARLFSQYREQAAEPVINAGQRSLVQARLRTEHQSFA